MEYPEGVSNDTPPQPPGYEVATDGNAQVGHSPTRSSNRGEDPTEAQMYEMFKSFVLQQNKGKSKADEVPEQHAPPPHSAQQYPKVNNNLNFQEDYSQPAPNNQSFVPPPPPQQYPHEGMSAPQIVFPPPQYVDQPQRGPAPPLINHAVNLNHVPMEQIFRPDKHVQPASIVTPLGFRANPHVFKNLPTFHGLDNENSYTFLSEYCQVCHFFTEPGQEPDTVYMCMFYLSMRDKAKNWILRLPARSITHWNQLL